MSFLMWEFEGQNTGRFHNAATKADRTAMIAQGFQDITGQQVWAVKYPSGKGNVITPKTSPKLKSKSTAAAATDPAPVV